MLKHVTLVLTLDAVEKIEERIIYHLHSPERTPKTKRFFSLNWEDEHYA